MSGLPTSADVVVVGAGPAGLTAAAELRRLGVGDVLVLDRDGAPGGVPRHSDHPGYGLRDLHRSLSGPAYARTLADRAVGAGAVVHTRATVTAVSGGPDPHVLVTAPEGRGRIDAGAVVLATGCRERPRSARLVPGTRPAGVFTTGWLQRLVHLEHGRPGTRAVVVGAEHVSYSAVLTLAEAGCTTVAMVTERDAPTTYHAFDAAARARFRFPLLTGTRVAAIRGAGRVDGVELESVRDGTRRTLACDTVVFTGDWVPEHELARRADLPVGPAGPLVDQALRTTTPGLLAVGNLVHPGATADVCALDGRHVAAVVRDGLRSGWRDGGGVASAGAAAAGAAAGASPAGRGVRIEADPPLLWVSPSRVTAGAGGAPRGRLLLLSDEPRRAPRLTARQGGRTLWSGRVPWAVPTRPFPVPAGWLAAVDPDAGPVRLSYA